MTLHLLFPTNEQPQPTDTCNGVIFRYTREAWIGSAKDVNFRDRYRLLTTLSCDGCNHCGWVWEALVEQIDNMTSGQEGIDGQLYKVAVTDVSTDWETNIVDDYTLAFVKHEPVKAEPPNGNLPRNTR